MGSKLENEATNGNSHSNGNGNPQRDLSNFSEMSSRELTEYLSKLAPTEFLKYLPNLSPRQLAYYAGNGALGEERIMIERYVAAKDNDYRTEFDKHRWFAG